MTEKQINQRIVEMQESMERKLPAYSRQVKQAFDLARARVSDILVKYVKNGKVPKNRIATINRELSAVEAALYRDLLSQTTIIIEDTVKDAGDGLNEALVIAIGVTALYAMQDEEESTEALSAAGFLLAIGMGLLALIKSVLSTVLGRRGDDGLNLKDRLRKLAADIIADVKKTLRKSNNTGEDYENVQRNIAEVFGDVEWRVNRIVDTEVAVAHRTAIARAAESSELVAALKIIDFPHGNNHESHKCYEYAHADEHGLGEGVYPVSTRKIRNPHPQCRARLVLVMKEGVLDA